MKPYGFGNLSFGFVMEGSFFGVLSFMKLIYNFSPSNGLSILPKLLVLTYV